VKNILTKNKFKNLHDINNMAHKEQKQDLQELQVLCIVVEISGIKPLSLEGHAFT